MGFVHHTENPNGYAPAEVPAMLRAIFAFHRFVNGWHDIGYNFVIDLYGRIFEARAGGVDEPVIGAHAGGYNAVSTGVAVLGSFMNRPVSANAGRALERLLAWKLSLHGVSAAGRVTVRVNPAGAVYSRFPANARVSLARVSGHRDADSTDCPGNALYGELPAVRASVRRLAPRPARATLILIGETPAAEQPATAGQTPPAVPPAAGAPGQPAAAGQPPAAAGQPPAAAGQPPAAAGQPPSAVPQPSAAAEQPPPAAALAGALALLDGTPIAGAPIVLQAREVSRRGEVVNERAVGQAVTDGAGKWSLPLRAVEGGGGGAWLRALWTGASAQGPAGAGAAVAGAAVSDPLFLAGSLAFSPPAAVPPTPPATPPPSP